MAERLPPSIPLPALGARLTLGRDAVDGQVAIDDRKVSRRDHARILRDEDGLWVEPGPDAGPTELGGHPLEARAALDEGAWLRLGSVPYERVGEALELRIDQDAVALELRGVTVDVLTDRGLRRLLDRVSLDIASGEFVGIIGPSGAGKSTLLRALAGEQELSGGHITARDDRGPLPGPWDARSLGFVPQDDALHGGLSVEASLRYAAALRLDGESASRRRRAVELALQRLDLEDRRAARIEDGLSGGQRKRVNIGQEILTLPRLLCLDEPTAGLDPFLERELMRSFRDMARQGCTVACTTHVLASLELFDRVIVLAEGGRLAFCGPPGELLARFEITALAELYPQLRGEAAHRFAPAPGPPPEPAPTTLRTRARRPLAGLTELPVLVGRFLHLNAEPKTLAATLLLPLLVGAAIRAALPGLVDRDSALFFTLVAALWFGLQGAAQELVRDRSIYLRERRTGLGALPYLSSKLIGLGLINLIQVLLLIAPCYMRFDEFEGGGLPTGWLGGFLSEDGGGFDGTVSGLVLAAAMLGTSLGLLVSSFARRERQAALMVPMLVIPMLLFSAKGMALSDTLGLLAERAPELTREWLAALNPARHLYELAYFKLRFERAPTWGEGWVEVLTLTALPLLALLLTAWRLGREGRGGSVWLGAHALPELDAPGASEAERAAALTAARLSAERGRCARCGYRIASPERCERCDIDPRSAAAGALLRPGSLSSELLTGALALPRGLTRMLRSPRLRALALLPVLANLVVVGAAFGGAWWLAERLADPPEGWLATWDAGLWLRLKLALFGLGAILGKASLLLVPLLGALLFATLGKVLLMPLMEFLAEKACEDVLGPPKEEPFSLGAFARDLAFGLWDAVMVLLLQLALLVLCWPLASLPLIGPVLWLTIPGALGATLDFLDLNLVVRHYSIFEKARLLWRRKGRLFGFGLSFFVLLELPWVNLLLCALLVPAAAVGSALLYLELDER